MAISTIGANSLAQSRILTAVQQPAGAVLQVVTFDQVASFSTTSTSFVSTGLAASITPTSSSSKILVLANLGSVYNASTSGQPRYTLYRGATNLGGNVGGVNDNFGEIYSSAGGIVAPAYFSYLDSPATTSSTTYSIYLRSNTGTSYIGFDSARNSVTLMEIAG